MILDFKTLKKGALVSLFALTFTMVLGLASVPFFWHAYILIFALKLVWCMHLICACEKYTSYVGTIVISMLGFLVIMAGSMAYFLAIKNLGLGNIEAVMVGMLPAAIVFSMYLFITLTKSSSDSFECDGIKVQPKPQPEKSSSASYPLLLLAGVTTLAASIFIKSVGMDAGGFIGVLLITGSAIYTLFVSRNPIRGLRTLRIRQKTMSTPYTFMLIDEIREARGRWWLSRLVKWVGSLYKS